MTLGSSRSGVTVGGYYSSGVGVGGALVDHLRHLSPRPMLVGTWQAAVWAIRFYQRHGFALASPTRKTILLKTYWTIPDRQVDTSVVLANPPLDEVIE